MNEIAPLTPDNAKLNHINNIPKEVIECWNECIQKNLKINGQNISSNFTLDELSQIITNKLNVNFDTANKNGWFDLEILFRKHGWKVVFDNPAYNENYKANYTFENKKTID